MSQTFTLTGRDNTISVDYFPPIELHENVQYKLGLIGLYTYNSIPNVDVGKNKFYWSDTSFEFPTGVYEISDIEYLLKVKLGGDKVSIKINNNTQKCELYSKFNIHFEHTDTIRTLLGFSRKLLSKQQKHISNLPVEVIKVCTVRVECNITSGAYYNNELVHTIHEFGVNVDPGYAISEVPHNIIYYPINTRTISNITLKIIDQDGDLINFQNELIVVRLELKEWD